MRLVGLIHSTRLVIEPIHRVMALQCPDIDFFHLMDEGILRKLTASGQITPEIIQWLAEMVLSAERAGADMAVVSCSSLSLCSRGSRTGGYSGITNRCAHDGTRRDPCKTDRARHDKPDNRGPVENTVSGSFPKVRPGCNPCPAPLSACLCQTEPRRYPGA